jgi:hypothetical protein
MSAPDIPQSYWIYSTLGGALDFNLDDIRIKEVNLPVIKLEANITNIPKITTDSKVDMGLDNIRIRELPKVEMEFGMKPSRIHLPSHYQFCFSLLGMEIFKFAFCGESMVVNEPYLPHQTEKCD